MFGTRSKYKRGDVVDFVCYPAQVIVRGDVIAVERDGTLGISTHRHPLNHIMVAPSRVVAATRKGVTL